MTAPMKCDHCGAEDAKLKVDSAIGLAVWNRIFPDDRREALFLCSADCCLLLGKKMGEYLKRLLAGESARQHDRLSALYRRGQA